MSVASLQEGREAARTTSTGIAGAGGKAFSDTYQAPQFDDIAGALVDLANTDTERSKKFVSAALAAAKSPSSSKQWESSYSMSKDKFDYLFSEEVLDRYSKDEASMNTWIRLVDELQDYVDSYEALYSDTYGDPYSADGKGITLSDHKFRERNFGSSDAYFESLGKQDISGNEPVDVLKVIDVQQHVSDSVMLDDNHNWQYDTLTPEGANFLELPDTTQAAALFGYSLVDRINSLAEFVVDPKLQKIGLTGGQNLEDHLINFEDKTSHIRSAIADYIKTEKVQDLTVDDFMDGSYKQKGVVGASYSDIDQIVKEFNVKIKDGILEELSRKKREKSANKYRSRSGSVTTYQSIKDSMEDFSLPSKGISEGQIFTLPSNFTFGGYSSVRQFILTEDGKIFVFGSVDVQVGTGYDDLGNVVPIVRSQEDYFELDEARVASFKSALQQKTSKTSDSFNKIKKIAEQTFGGAPS